MSRIRLRPDDLRLIKMLRRLRGMAGWTISRQAAELGLPAETLRGVLFRKNRPGPHVLDQTLRLTLRLKAHMGTELPVSVNELQTLVLRLLRPHARWLTRGLRQRITSDFSSIDELLKFLKAKPSEWQQFGEGGDPSPALLSAIAHAYRTEAQWLDNQGRRGVCWCEETAAVAERLLAISSEEGAE